MANFEYPLSQNFFKMGFYSLVIRLLFPEKKKLLCDNRYLKFATEYCII